MVSQAYKSCDMEFNYPSSLLPNGIINGPSSYTKQGRGVQTYVQPKSDGQAGSSGRIVSFNMPSPSVMSYVEGAYLTFDVINQDPAQSARVVVGQTIIEQVVLKVPNGNNETRFSLNDYMETFVVLPDDKRRQKARAFGINANPEYQDPYAIPEQVSYDEDDFNVLPGQRKKFVIESNLSFVRSKMPIFTTNEWGSTTIEFTIKQNPLTSYSPSQTGVADNFQMLYEGFLYDEKKMREMKSRYMGKSLLSRSVKTRLYQSIPLTLTIGQQSQRIQFTDISGVFHGFFIIVRRQDAIANTQEGLYDSRTNFSVQYPGWTEGDPYPGNFVPIDDVTFWYNNHSLLAAQRLTKEASLATFSNAGTESTLLNEKNIFYIGPTERLDDAILKGLDGGSVRIDPGTTEMTVTMGNATPDAPGGTTVNVVVEVYGLRGGVFAIIDDSITYNETN
jgi:hypothetical protein